MWPISNTCGTSSCLPIKVLFCATCVFLAGQTVAVLMKNKEGATDIGKAQRRVLQPQVASRMAQMSAARRAEFEGRVQATVENIVNAAKRRYLRRQKLLDETGVFHPEANAHR